MLNRARFFTLILAALPALAAAQAPAPVAKAFRDDAADKAKNLIAAAEEMPAANFGFKPTPAQMSFASVVMHLAQGNDFLCGAIGGVKAPARTTVADTAAKAVLMRRVYEFSYALARAGAHEDVGSEALDAVGLRAAVALAHLVPDPLALA